MSVDEKDTEQEEGKTTEANTNIDEDQELKALPENEVKREKIVEVEDAAIKSLPRATITTHIGKRKKKPPLQKQQQQKKEIPIPNLSKRLDQQSTEIKKIKSVLQSHQN